MLWSRATESRRPRLGSQPHHSLRGDRGQILTPPNLFLRVYVPHTCRYQRSSLVHWFLTKTLRRRKGLLLSPFCRGGKLRRKEIQEFCRRPIEKARIWNKNRPSAPRALSPSSSALSGTQPLATCGQGILDMWQLWIKMCCQYEIHVGLERLGIKKQTNKRSH